MRKNRTEILAILNNSNHTHKELISASESLLDDCKSLGTVYFSTMARIAFVASIIIKNLVKSGIITEKFVNDFMNSINSPLSQFQIDHISFTQNKISKKQFLHKYGHLRPGTYDITATRYDKDSKFLENMKSLKLPKTKK